MKARLEATHKIILRPFARYINYYIDDWKNHGIDREYKLKYGTSWLKFGLEEEDVMKIRSQIKFVNHWFFIHKTKYIVSTGIRTNIYT